MVGSPQRPEPPEVPLVRLREAGDVVDPDYPLFLIDRVEHAVPVGSQAPQVRRPVSE